MTTVIVSGTRGATAAQHTLVVAARLSAFAFPDPDPASHNDMRLVHGDADGLDHLARDIARSWGWEAIPVPAQWGECGDDCPPSRSHRRTQQGGRRTYCPLAGQRRNMAMVDLYGASSLGLLAFPAVGSKGRSGTWNCIHYAADQGLHVVVKSLEVA